MKAIGETLIENLCMRVYLEVGLSFGLTRPGSGQLGSGLEVFDYYLITRMNSI